MRNEILNVDIYPVTCDLTIIIVYIITMMLLAEKKKVAQGIEGAGTLPRGDSLCTVGTGWRCNKSVRGR